MVTVSVLFFLLSDACNCHMIPENKSSPEAPCYCSEIYTDLVNIRDDQCYNEVNIKVMKYTRSTFCIGLLWDERPLADGGNSTYRKCTQPHPPGECVNMHNEKQYLVLYDCVYCAPCYRTFIHVSSEILSWEKALDYCAKEGRAGLLTIKSQTVQNDVEAELRKRNISGPVWVGLVQSQLFGFWMWPNGTAVFPYSNWDEDKHPEHHVSEHCGAVVPQNNYRWNDRNCQAKYITLCHTAHSTSNTKGLKGSLFYC